MIRFEQGLCDYVASARGMGLLLGSAALTAGLAALVLVLSASCHG